MIEILNINKSYVTKRYTVFALKNISLKFNNTGLYIITGKSGSGKSTLLYSISNYIELDSGEIIIDGVKNNIEDGIKNEVGFIYQNHNLLADLDVFDNIIFGIKINENIIEKANKILFDLDIENIKHKFINELSGGEIQRVAVARSLLRDATIILADEPTANLDSINSKNVISLLKQISKEKLVIMITHDESIVEKFADYHIEMVKGEAIFNSILDKQCEPLKIVDNIKSVEFKLENSIKKKLITRNLVNSKSTLITLIVVLSLLIGLILTTFTLHNYQEYEEVYRLSQLEKYNKTFDIYEKTSYDDIFLRRNYNNVKKGYLLEEKLNKNNIDFQKVYSTVINQLDVNYIVENDYDKFDVTGSVPKEPKQVVMTDFLYTKLFRTNQFFKGKTVSLFDDDYSVVGIIKTGDSNSVKNETNEKTNYLNDIYGISLTKIKATSYQSVSPFKIKQTTNYTNDSKKIINGRNIEKTNEIIVSNEYFNHNNLALNREYKVIDIYDNKYNGYFGDKLNPYKFLGEKVIIVGTHDEDSNSITVHNKVFESIEAFYRKYLINNKIRISNLKGIDKFKKIYENNIEIDHPTINHGKMFIYFKNNLSFLFIPFEILLSSIIVLLIYIITKILIIKKTSEIAIMQSLSTRKRDIFGLFSLQLLVIYALIIICCLGVYMGINRFINESIKIKEISHFNFIEFRYDIFSVITIGVLLIFLVFNLRNLLKIFNKPIMKAIKNNK